MGSIVEFGAQFVDGLGVVLRIFNDWVAFTGGYSWGFAIILLTVLVRIILLPLAIKQINSMRAMQTLQPEMKKIQGKFKTDRSLMKTNPEKYRAQQQKQREAMMALYKEHNVNPAAGCLPLLAQAPIFFALFRLLYSERIPELDQAGFPFISSLSSQPIDAGAGAFVLAILMGLTTYLTQKQMMASNPASAQMPQQKVMLYVMPVMLLAFSFNIPVGVLLYWVTTNVWTMGQQWFMFRNIDTEGSAKAT